jgi:RimJ/RimL family protein N-acetyltransferase
MIQEPISLTGQLVHLEPLSESHVPDLTMAGQGEAIWRYMPFGLIQSEEQMRAFVRDMLSRHTQETDVPFAVIVRETGRAVGCTRYQGIEPKHRTLEIGGTWYGTAYQRTGVNTECKYLLLGHAFEVLACNRVQFKTDLRNERSQKALERIGAVREGIMRNHMIMPDGVVRSSVFYSILQDDWEAVKLRLERLLMPRVASDYILRGHD